MGLAATAAASKYAGKVEEFLEEYLITEEGPGTVVFGGRDEELKRLDDWLADDRAAPRFVLVAPAGRGKSALLVHWLTRLRMAGRVGDGEERWRLVFFPISMRFSTHVPRLFYEALAARLNEIVQGELKPPAEGTDPAAYYEDRCRRLLAVAVERKTPILIVIDGIDEALGGRFSAEWFPRVGGAPLRLLVSARLQIGDSDARGWVERLEWDADVRVQTHELPILGKAAVRNLLGNAGAPVDVLSSRPDIIRRLHELTGGEPLLLKFYVQDLWKRGDEAGRLKVEDLADIKPGFGGYFKYFKRGLTRQQKVWEEEQKEGSRYDEATLEAYLAVLACAYGRLTAEELGEVARRVHDLPPSFRVENALRPLRRFIIGADSRSQEQGAGFVLSHPKLGEYLREDYFDRHRVEQARRAFADWGRDVLRRLNAGELAAERAPSYLLQYLGQHLGDVGAPARDFMSLVEEGWLRAWEAFEGGYRGFAQDVRRTAEAIAHQQGTESQPVWAWQLRCKLTLSSIASVGSQISGELLAKCVQHGLLSPRQALHWIEYKGKAERTVALAELAPHLPEALLGEALGAARAIGTERYRAEALAELAPRLPEAERIEVLGEALGAARAIGDEGHRAAALTALAPRLPQKLQKEAISSFISSAHRLKRSDLLGCLPDFLPIVAQCEGKSGSREIWRAIYQTSQWFP